MLPLEVLGMYSSSQTMETMVALSAPLSAFTFSASLLATPDVKGF